MFRALSEPERVRYRGLETLAAESARTTKGLDASSQALLDELVQKLEFLQGLLPPACATSVARYEAYFQTTDPRPPGAPGHARARDEGGAGAGAPHQGQTREVLLKRLRATEGPGEQQLMTPRPRPCLEVMQLLRDQSYSMRDPRTITSSSTASSLRRGDRARGADMEDITLRGAGPAPAGEPGGRHRRPSWAVWGWPGSRPAGAAARPPCPTRPWFPLPRRRPPARSSRTREALMNDAVLRHQVVELSRGPRHVPGVEGARRASIRSSRPRPAEGLHSSGELSTPDRSHRGRHPALQPLGHRPGSPRCRGIPRVDPRPQMSSSGEPAGARSSSQTEWSPRPAAGRGAPDRGPRAPSTPARGVGPREELHHLVAQHRVVHEGLPSA